MLAPRIDTMFAKKQLTMGNNPLMRWFINNVAVTMQPDGSKNTSRRMKLDVKQMDFMQCSMPYIEHEILEFDQPFIMADISF